MLRSRTHSNYPCAISGNEQAVTVYFQDASQGEKDLNKCKAVKFTCDNTECSKQETTDCPAFLQLRP